MSRNIDSLSAVVNKILSQSNRGGRWLHKTRNHAQQGGFPAAGRSKQNCPWFAEFKFDIEGKRSLPVSDPCT
jgi:hypothetical protein